MKRWWAERASWQQVTIVAVTIVIAIAIIGAAVGGGDDDKVAAGQTTTEAAPAAPIPATEDPVAEEAAEPADTGRMSQGEWDVAQEAVFGVNDEVQDYGQKLGARCAVLLQALEVSDALSCIDDAYDGVEGQVLVSVDELDGLKSDVGKRCLKGLTYAYNVLNEDLFRSLRVSKAALNSLEPLAIDAATPALTRQRNRWDDASGDMLQLCAPAA